MCPSSACIDTISRAERSRWCLFSLHHWVLQENCQEKPAWDSSWWEQPKQGFLDAQITFDFCTTLSLLCAGWLWCCFSRVCVLCVTHLSISSFPVFHLVYSVTLFSHFSFCLSDFLLIQPISYPNFCHRSSEPHCLCIIPLSLPHLCLIYLYFRPCSTETAYDFLLIEGCLIHIWSIVSIRISC